MERELLKSLICVCDGNGNPKGAGLLIDSEHIITCAHVVAQSVGYIPDEETYLGRELEIILFADGKPSATTAEVVSMFPQSNVDFAGLKLKIANLEDSFSNKLLGDTNLTNHSLRVYGFPNNYDNGVWSYGVVRGVQTDGLLQIESNINAAYLIKGGFSGSPVWDDELGGWIGIVNQADFLPEGRGATVVPASVLYQCWSEVLCLTATPEPQYLSDLVDRFKLTAGIIAYVPPKIEITVKTRKPQPHIAEGIKWDSEFDDSKDTARTDDAYKTKEIKTGLSDVLRSYPRFVLLGELGSGKSTSLHYEIIQLAENRLKNGTGPIPLLVDLSEEWIIPENDETNRSYQNGFRNLLERNWNLDIELNEALSSARVIVFLDGLNEMGAASSQKVRALKKWLFEDSSPKYVVIACRESSYEEDLNLGLPTASLSQLSSNNWEKISNNLISYFNITQPSQLQTEDFLSAVRNKNNLSEILDRKPYFTARLLNIWIRGKELPESEALILDDFISVIWKRETEQQLDLPKLSVLKKLLGNLATLLILQQKDGVDYNNLARSSTGTLGFLFRRNDLDRLYVVAKAAKRADLIQEENSRYRFHDKFLENYFAAVHMLENPDSAIPRAEDKSVDKSMWQDAVNYFYQLLGTDSRATNILRKVVKRNPSIAVDFVVESGFQRQYVNVVTDSLVDYFHENRAVSSAEASSVTALNKLKNHSHPYISLALRNSQDDSLKTLSTIILCEKLKVIEAIPTLKNIIKDEKKYKDQINVIKYRRGSVTRKRNREILELIGGIGMLGLATILPSLLSGQPISSEKISKEASELFSKSPGLKMAFGATASEVFDGEKQKGAIDDELRELYTAIQVVEKAKSTVKFLERIKD
ncbi:MAG: trypsin-like peptidase domain-containing protein [Thainema sp.]